MRSAPEGCSEGDPEVKRADAGAGNLQENNDGAEESVEMTAAEPVETDASAVRAAEVEDQRQISEPPTGGNAWEKIKKGKERFVPFGKEEGGEYVFLEPAELLAFGDREDTL